MGKNKRAAILYSGGIESAVLTTMIHNSNKLGKMIHIDYGQVTKQAELKAANNLINHLGIAEEVLISLKIPLHHYVDQHQLETNPLFTGVLPKPKEVFHREDYAEVKNDAVDDNYGWINARNSVMLLHACIYASYHGCDAVYAGFQCDVTDRLEETQLATDRCIDSTSHYIDLLNKLLFYSFQHPMKIETPLRMFSKREVVSLASSFGLDLKKVSFSCTIGKDEHCGQCTQCIDRLRYVEA